MSFALHFCRCDKNGDGRLSEEEVKEVRELLSVSFVSILYISYELLNFLTSCGKVLVMSASANRLSNFKINAATYAALIMEELDPDHMGFIEVRIL